MPTLVWWAAGAAVLAVCICAVIIVIRFNQLSLARDLCAESRRQLDVDIADRRTLIPSFVESCSQLRDRHAGIERRISAVSAAYAAARQAAAPEAVGRCEEGLTVALAQLDHVIGPRPAAAAEPATDAEYIARALFIQMSVLEARIAAGARYHTANVARYAKRRRGLIPALLPHRFPVYEPVPYTATELDLDTGGQHIVQSGDTDYRPGRLSEGA